MGDRELAAPDAGWLARAPSGGLVLGAIASVQFGSALAATLFDRLGPGGAVLLRLLSASIVLVAVWRPRLERKTRRELLLIAAFGLVLAGMNLSFYQALERIPLGIAVTIEFVGPLAVAVGGSRRRIDLLWVGLAAAGMLALTRGRAQGLDGLGIAFALLAGGCWGAYIVLNARVGRAFERGTGLALSMCVASLAALPTGFSREERTWSSPSCWRWAPRSGCFRPPFPIRSSSRRYGASRHQCSAC